MEGCERSVIFYAVTPVYNHTREYNSYIFIYIHSPTHTHAHTHTPLDPTHPILEAQEGDVASACEHGVSHIRYTREGVLHNQCQHPTADRVASDSEHSSSQSMRERQC